MGCLSFLTVITSNSSSLRADLHSLLTRVLHNANTGIEGLYLQD